MNATTISILFAGLIIAGSVFLTGASSSPPIPGDSPENIQNVSIVDGKQIIDVTVRGGYTPKKSIAKAGVPTIVRFNTSSTYDCSASIRIPSLGISKFLPATGATDIDVGTPQVSTLRGTCGMGMYSFEIDFQG